ncbi:MAG: hypothetical protein ABI955_03820, partial [Nitrospirota bacterium]
NARQFPVTDALNEMKALTMAGTPFEFWYSILERGTLDLGYREWQSRVEKDKLHQQYADWAKDLSSRKSTQTQLGMALKKICPHRKDCWIHDTYDSGPKRGWDFGDLKKCRDAFCRFFDWSNHDWGDAQNPEFVSDLAAQRQEGRSFPMGMTESSGRHRQITDSSQFHDRME